MTDRLVSGLGFGFGLLIAFLLFLGIRIATAQKDSDAASDPCDVAGSEQDDSPGFDHEDCAGAKVARVQRSKPSQGRDGEY